MDTLLYGPRPHKPGLRARASCTNPSASVPSSQLRLSVVMVACYAGGLAIRVRFPAEPSIDLVVKLAITPVF